MFLQVWPKMIQIGVIVIWNCVLESLTQNDLLKWWPHHPKECLIGKSLVLLNGGENAEHKANKHRHKPRHKNYQNNLNFFAEALGAYGFSNMDVFLEKFQTAFDLVIAQLDDLCYLYLDFYIDHLVGGWDPK